MPDMSFASLLVRSLEALAWVVRRSRPLPRRIPARVAVRRKAPGKE
jgi:hypothetical protein